MQVPQACRHRSAGCAARAGRDPKPWPPPFKLNREMVDAMGGADSEPYRRFRAYACEAYNILRKRAPRALSLRHPGGACWPCGRACPGAPGTHRPRSRAISGQTCGRPISERRR